MNLPLAPLAGIVAGVAAAAGLALMPSPMLEGLVTDSGVPAILAAAEPPLGMTARLMIAGGTGALVALLGWFALFLLLGTRSLAVGGKPAPEREVPHVRRADAHPDAPPRAPLLATRDLGTPFLEVSAPVEPAPTAPAASRPDAIEAQKPLFTPVHLHAPPAPPPAEQPLPANLDQPLSAYDPGAIPEVPMPPPVQLPPLRRARRPAVFEAGERLETFELTPIRRAPAPVPPPAVAPVGERTVRPETEATIHALLERLERGVVRRGLATGVETRPRDAERGLEDALVTLRNLARRA